MEIDDYVQVKLTKVGAEILNTKYSNINDSANTFKCDHNEGDIYHCSFWLIMSTFGGIAASGKIPFTDLELYKII